MSSFKTTICPKGFESSDEKLPANFSGSFEEVPFDNTTDDIRCYKSSSLGNRTLRCTGEEAGGYVYNYMCRQEDPVSNWLILNLILVFIVGLALIYWLVKERHEQLRLKREMTKVKKTATSVSIV